MHILIGIITAIAGLIWALNSLHNAGVDLNSFNPFTWARRRKWEAQYGAKPMLNLEKPLEAAGAVALSLLEELPVVTKEQKDGVIALFQDTFQLAPDQASELFTSSAYLVKGEVNLHESVPKILAPSLPQFTSEMRESLLNLLKSIASLDGSTSEAQSKIIESAATALKLSKARATEWG